MALVVRRDRSPAVRMIIVRALPLGPISLLPKSGPKREPTSACGGPLHFFDFQEYKSGVRASANCCSERLVFQSRGCTASILLHARIQKAKPLPGEAGASIQEPLSEGGIEGRGPRYPESYVARSRGPRAALHYILAMKQGATSAVPGAG